MSSNQYGFEGSLGIGYGKKQNTNTDPLKADHINKLEKAIQYLTESAGKQTGPWVMPVIEGNVIDEFTGDGNSVEFTLYQPTAYGEGWTEKYLIDGCDTVEGCNAISGTGISVDSGAGYVGAMNDNYYGARLDIDYRIIPASGTGCVVFISGTGNVDEERLLGRVIRFTTPPEVGDSIKVTRKNVISLGSKLNSSMYVL